MVKFKLKGKTMRVDLVKPYIKDSPSNKKRLFVDMDGTLAEWRKISFDGFCSEEFSTMSMQEKLNKVLYSPGYFSSLKEYDHVVRAIDSLIDKSNGSSIEVYVLSCCLPDKDGVSPRQQKNEWLDKHLPGIDQAHRIFVPDGESKTKYVPGGIKAGDFLLDDYTKNLVEWESSGKGVGIKLLNEVNSTNGKWHGSKISNGMLSKYLKKAILLITEGGTVEHTSPPRNQRTIHFTDFLNRVEKKDIEQEDTSEPEIDFSSK